MERLTMIDGCGNDELVRCMSCGLEKAGADLEHCGMCEEGWQRALKKLAAYEDTGLEPDDITRPFDETTILQLAGSVLGVSPDRLRALAQADREGRCVVLPCKVGDTVYRVVTLPSGPPLLSEMKITTMKQAVSLVNLVGKHKLVSYYLTREEAEAALREAEPSGT